MLSRGSQRYYGRTRVGELSQGLEPRHELMVCYTLPVSTTLRHSEIGVCVWEGFACVRRCEVCCGAVATLGTPPAPDSVYIARVVRGAAGGVLHVFGYATEPARGVRDVRSVAGATDAAGQQVRG